MSFRVDSSAWVQTLKEEIGEPDKIDSSFFDNDGHPPDDDDVAEEDLRDEDILGGRGGLSNHHVGNKRFRKIVADLKNTYQDAGDKTNKTALARAIVQYVQMEVGGRFLIKPKGQVRWRVMTSEQARKKTSQALREREGLT